ncbi:hypothetical protein, partial [Listeria monocytogenes]|uniref:hypothetical protein n=1 Tax=Listeria monocytogenes TaxID=1639 RepID=UPI001F0D7443
MSDTAFSLSSDQTYSVCFPSFKFWTVATGTIAAYYAIDNPDAKQVIQTAASTGKNVAVSGQVPVATVQ